jgi:hypothetical protein
MNDKVIFHEGWNRRSQEADEQERNALLQKVKAALNETLAALADDVRHPLDVTIKLRPRISVIVRPSDDDIPF